MRLPLSYFQTNLLMFLAPIGLIAFAILYVERVMGLAPCPLCITQRIFFLLIAVFAFFALFNKRNVILQRLLAFFGLASSLAGLGVAIRHIWLQNLPEEEKQGCGVGSLDYLWEGYRDDFYTLSEFLATLFRGTGDCTEIQLFLGLSIPLWALIAFVGFAVLCIAQGVRKLPA